MMWTILVTWAAINGTYQDMWLVTDPVFYSQESCLAYGQAYRQQIYEDAMVEFNTAVLPNKMYCLDEAARDFLQKKGVQVEQL
jgi:hypothetical protein